MKQNIIRKTKQQEPTELLSKKREKGEKDKQ